MTYRIYDLSNSFLMGLDLVGMALERRSASPATLGGRAHRRYMEYVRGFVPEDFRPDLHPEVRVQRYFQVEGLHIAPANVYVALAATFLSWPLLPVIQLLNLLNLLRSRLARRRDRKSGEAQR